MGRMGYLVCWIGLAWMFSAVVILLVDDWVSLSEVHDMEWAATLAVLPLLISVGALGLSVSLGRILGWERAAYEYGGEAETEAPQAVPSEAPAPEAPEAEPVEAAEVAPEEPEGVEGAGEELPYLDVPLDLQVAEAGEGGEEPGAGPCPAPYEVPLEPAPIIAERTPPVAAEPVPIPVQEAQQAPARAPEGGASLAGLLYGIPRGESKVPPVRAAEAAARGKPEHPEHPEPPERGAAEAKETDAKETRAEMLRRLGRGQR